MLDFAEINKTIEELESGETTYDSCQKLATLYTVRQYNQGITDDVVKEYNDILPSYSKYCEVKTKYQMSEIGEDAVHTALKSVCKEISEFLQILYNNTDTQVERDIINSIIPFAKY